MSLDERFAWLVFGCMIGFVLGYVVRSLREIKEELHEVDTMIKRDRDDRGMVSIDFAKNIALLLVVVITAYAAFASQSNSNAVEENQRQIDKSTHCTAEYLDKTIVALNERTTYSVDQARANETLQKAQARYFTLLLTVPPLSDPELRAALEDYFDALNRYLSLVNKTAGKTSTNAYPTPEELNSCLLED